MSTIDLVGYAAGACVIVAFHMRDQRRLRLCAIASNLTFVVYGLAAGIPPVVLLHAILLPLNLVRLRQIAARRG